MARVELREITKDTLRPILELELAPGQERFVASNAISIAQAHFEPKAWFRGIYADDEPVGFVMLEDSPEVPEYYLWRLMIAADHQGRGFGRAAVDLLCDHVRTRPGATELLTSYVPGDDGPEGFYLRLGFTETGEVEDDEVVSRLPL